MPDRLLDVEPERADPTVTVEPSADEVDVPQPVLVAAATA